MRLVPLLFFVACAGQDPRVPGLEKRLAELEKEVAELRQRVRNKQEIAEESVVGKTARFVAQEWMQGETTLDEGKATLLVFWEPWCPHCKREVPELQKVYEELRPQGLNVVGITRLTRSSTPEKAMKFLEDHGVEYPIMKDDGTMGEHYAVSGVPAVALVKNDTIVWRGHPQRLNRKMIETTLAAN